MNIRKKKTQFLLFVSCYVALSVAAKSFRDMVGKAASSKTGHFSLLDCFDWSTGSVACTVKEAVKLCSNSIRDTHAELTRQKSVKNALDDAASQGLSGKQAEKHAKKEGDKAAKRADRNADRVLGPIVSSGWDFFEVMYYGGTITEGFLRAGGTLVGTYAVGFLAQQRFGRFGYLLGSTFGSWIGGRIGLLVFDIVNGVHYLLRSI
ncbi:uncharacterized protein LOC141664596 [Apium graveolens]|uniref:uncharacterized protein LOC141664596 n=1 Tax=Apium graveolens TaxID=4045 RepID=UPI003D7A7CDD